MTKTLLITSRRFTKPSPGHSKFRTKHTIEETSVWADEVPTELPEKNGNFEAVDMAFPDTDFPINNNNEENASSEGFGFFDYPKISENDLKAAVNNQPIRWEMKFRSNVKTEMN